MPTRIPVVLSSDNASVGVLRWRVRTDPMLTILVKATFRFDNEEMATIVSPAPGISLDVPLADAPNEFRYVSDFAPNKPQIDILLVGHAFGVGTTIEAALSMGAFSRRFTAVSKASAGRLPLTAAHVCEADGLVPSRVGPVRALPPYPPKMRYEPGFDFGIFHVAPPSQIVDELDLEAPLSLAGLSPHGTRTFRLPPVSPRIVIEAKYDRCAVVDPPCDTLWFDTDHHTCTVIWRSVLDADPLEIERLLVSLEPSGEQRRDLNAMRRAAPRWKVRFAAEPERLPQEPVNEDETDEQMMVQYELLCAEHGVDPTISLDAYVAVAAELAEQREPREDVLRRHQLSENEFLLEERGWLERATRDAEAGDGSLAAEMGEKMQIEQERLAGSREASVTLEQYAAINAALDVKDQREVLGEHKLSVPAWMRVERRFDEAMKNDPELSARYDALLEEERSKIPDDTDEDEEAS